MSFGCIENVPLDALLSIINDTMSPLSLYFNSSELMIVADLYLDTQKKPLERVEIWNIAASDPFRREPIKDVCNYGFKVIKNPDSVLNKFMSEMFGSKSMTTRIANHYTLQSSWSLLLKILEHPENMSLLNTHRVQGTGGNIRIVMSLWPRGDSRDAETLSAMEVKTSSNGYKYTVTDSYKLNPPFSLQAENPIEGDIQDTRVTPWDICLYVLTRLKTHGCFSYYAQPVLVQPTVSRRQVVADTLTA